MLGIRSVSLRMFVAYRHFPTIPGMLHADVLVASSFEQVSLVVHEILRAGSLRERQQVGGGAFEISSCACVCVCGHVCVEFRLPSKADVSRRSGRVRAYAA